MFLWWETYTNFQQSVFIIAVAATAIMVVFLVLMLLGVHGDNFDGDAGVGDGHIDFSHSGSVAEDVSGLHDDVFNDDPISAFSGLRLITLRGVLAFFSVGGWVTLLLSQSTQVYWAILFGALAGLVAMWLLAFAIKQMMRLEYQGNIRYENALGKVGTVYLRVPKEMSGRGKVNVVVQERYVEVDAMTKDTEDIPVGSPIKVLGMEGPEILLVTRQKSE